MLWALTLKQMVESMLVPRDVGIFVIKAWVNIEELKICCERDEEMSQPTFCFSEYPNCLTEIKTTSFVAFQT